MNERTDLDSFLDYAAYLCEDDEVEYIDNENELDESIVVKWVYRNGKKIKKYKSTKAPKYKIQVDKTTGKPKEVRIKFSERKARRLAQSTRGAIKRKAKQNKITKQRERTFRARKNGGMKYNYKIPDLVTARVEGLVVPSDIRSHQTKGGPKLIHPMMKTESFLMETPHVEFKEDLWWDFCAEEGFHDGHWLKQLINIFNRKPVKSLRDDRNELYDYVLDLSTIPTEQIVKSMLDQLDFCSIAYHDFKLLSQKDKEEILNAVPEEIGNLLKYGHKYN